MPDNTARIVVKIRELSNGTNHLDRLTARSEQGHKNLKNLLVFVCNRVDCGLESGRVVDRSRQV